MLWVSSLHRFTVATRAFLLINCFPEGTFGCAIAYDGFPTTIFKCGPKHEDVYRGSQGPSEQPNLKLRWQRGEECPGTCHAAGADGKGAECRVA